MPSLKGWFLGHPGQAAYFVNRYTPWLVPHIPLIARSLPWALAAYLTYKKLRRR